MKRFGLMVQGIALAALAAPQVQAGDASLRSVLIAEGFDRPLFVTHAPGDYGRIFVLTKTGRLFVVHLATGEKKLFLNIDPISSSTSERGLLGMAFHPNFPATNAFFINYTDNDGNTVIARYSVSENPDVADENAEIVLTHQQPAPNHNGGWLGFGPDGYLYIALGDGGDQRDPNGLGQRIDDELLGNVLRIDVDADDFPDDLDRNYAIPADNPFVGAVGEDEIWAYGLRNPWRCAFDSLTGDLYIADVGERELEEINFQPAISEGGENYGWSCFEGTTCQGFAGCDCKAVESVPPLHQYGHTNGRCSVTGGEVYRGCATPELDGAYFFADLCSNEIWSLRDIGGGPLVIDRTDELAPPPMGLQLVSSFGTDAAGEVYICDFHGGKVWRIAEDPPLGLTASDPPDEAIDARVPVQPDGKTPAGWDRWTVRFNREANCLSPTDFAVLTDPPQEPLPTVAQVTPGDDEAAVVLNAVIPPGDWIRLFHYETLTGVRMAALPGDVDASRVAAPVDILALVDDINGAIPPRPLRSADVDRSGAVDPADVTALTGLFEGTIDGRIWLGATLPE